MLGVFDSGFGGLHVLRGMVARLPQYSCLYLGDSARAPYGSRSQEEVYRFTKQGVDFLFGQGATLVILACNTASSEALRKVQVEYGATRKVLGVLIPFAEAAAARSRSKQVGVMATEGTVRSGAYVRELTKLVPDMTIVQQACPRLVPLVEEGEQDSDEARSAVAACVRPLVAEGIDTLVLGCTHYGILEPYVREAAGEDIEIISDRDVVPQSLAAYLKRHPEIEARLDKGKPPRIFTTGDVETFDRLGSILFGQPVHAERAYLGE